MDGMTGDGAAMEPKRTFATLQDQLEAHIAEPLKPGVSSVGRDWWQYTEADRAVFQIEQSRWPRMYWTYHCYEAFKRIADADWGDALIDAARAQYPQWCVELDGRPAIDHNEFMDFAKAFGGLTNREAYAMYRKHEWWLIRAGVLNYRDEPES